MHDRVRPLQRVFLAPPCVSRVAFRVMSWVDDLAPSRLRGITFSRGLLTMPELRHVE